MTRQGLPHLMKAVKAVTCWELLLPLEQLGAIGSYCLPEDLHEHALQPFCRINQVHGYALTSGIAEGQPAIL